MIKKHLLIAVLVLTLLTVVPSVYHTNRLQAGCGYSYPTYYSSTYYPTYCGSSYSYYTPTYNCYSTYTNCYTPCYEPYHYDCAGWWRGKWYPAGWYQWRGSYYYLRDYGPCYGYSSPAGYYGHSCDPIQVSQFAAVLSVPIPTYYSTYIAPPEYPEKSVGVSNTRSQVGVSGSVGAQSVQQRAYQQTDQTGQGSQVSQTTTTQNTQVTSNTELLQVLTAIKTLDSNVIKLDGRLRKLEGVPPQFNTPNQQLPPNQVQPNTREEGDNPPPLPSERPTPTTPPVNTPPAPSTKTAISILTEHCANCHTEGKLFRGKDKNGKDRSTSFVLLKSPGVLADLDSRMQGRVLTMCYERKMPPTDIEGNHIPLSDEEMDVLVGELDKMMKESNAPLPLPPVHLLQPKPLQESPIPTRRNYANSTPTSTVQSPPSRRRGGVYPLVNR